MGNSLSSISPLPRSIFHITLAQAFLPFLHITLVQACLPYHPCTGLSSISPMSKPVFHLVQACLAPCPVLSSISPLPNPVFHITLAQSCLPYHPCPIPSSMSPLPSPAPWRDYSRSRSMATRVRRMPKNVVDIIIFARSVSRRYEAGNGTHWPD